MVLSPVLLLIFGFFILMAGVETVVEAETLAAESRPRAYGYIFFVFTLYAGPALLHFVSPRRLVSTTDEGRGTGGVTLSHPRARSAGCVLALCLGRACSPLIAIRDAGAARQSRGSLRWESACQRR